MRKFSADVDVIIEVTVQVYGAYQANSTVLRQVMPYEACLVPRSGDELSWSHPTDPTQEPLVLRVYSFQHRLREGQVAVKSVLHVANADQQQEIVNRLSAFGFQLAIG